MAQTRARSAYPVKLDPEPEGGFTVSFPDFGTPEQPGAGGYSYGRDSDEALAQAEDLLETIVANCMAEGWDIPDPGPAKGRPLVPLAPLVAIKVELYRTMRAAGISEAELARQMRITLRDAQNLFDTNHMSRLDQLAAGFAALGRRLVVTSEAA